MRKSQLEQGDLYMANERVRDFSIKNLSDAQIFFDERLELLFGSRPKFREFIDLYGRLNQLERYAMLAAHGDANGTWTYHDGERELKVQDWINRHDGKYSGLLIHVCNPGSYTPIIRKSALLVPDTDIDFSGGDSGKTAFSLIVPVMGGIDSYTIDYEVEQLNWKLQR